MPLFIKVDTGTSYKECYRLNPVALWLLACGWEIQTLVIPKL